jgi:hypothetical protein
MAEPPCQRADRANARSTRQVAPFFVLCGLRGYAEPPPENGQEEGGPVDGTTPQRDLLVATSTTLAKCQPTPALVLTRVFAVDGSERRVADGIRLFANSEIGQVWVLADVAPGG